MHCSADLSPRWQADRPSEPCCRVEDGESLRGFLSSSSTLLVAEAPDDRAHDETTRSSGKDELDPPTASFERVSEFDVVFCW